MKKFFSGLGQLAGIITILVFAFVALDALIGFDFITPEIDEVIRYVQTYAVYVVAGLAGLEFFSGKKIFFWIFVVIIAFVVISSFFPQVMDQIWSIVE